ncbi:outer membrane protein assembly factor BamB family protein [Paenibacillus sonchi]|uniref:outer membrane protein assembly factor BamB family protein n=1 Tax=Paenibacillus sonchi TaxID=373687 RepID=UPI000584341A|nr:PQQ-binding-like beta-propeller repeat protein [Paenibacillus sonchi]
MKKKLVSFIVATFAFANVTGVVAAKNYDSLPQAVWSQTTNADYIPIQEESFFVPGKETLYLHVGEERASETKVWSPDTLRAVDPKTGKVKWVFSFAKAGYGWPSTEGPFAYAPDGTVYAYFSSEGLLYSVSPDGKENWSKRIGRELALSDGKLYRMGDGTLIIAAQKSMKIGAETVQFLSFDKNGKQKVSKVVSGKLNTVTKNQIAIEVVTKEGDTQKVDVYNSSLQRSFQYNFPKGTYVNFYTAFALDDGTFIFSVIPKPKTQKLIAVSPQGKTIWGRIIDQFGFAFKAGSEYLVFNTHTKKISLFNQEGLVKERILANLTLPEGDGLPTANKTADGKLLVNLLSKQYIFDAKTLSTIHEFNQIKGTILDYRQNSVIVFSWQENKISMHLLN